MSLKRAVTFGISTPMNRCHSDISMTRAGRCYGIHSNDNPLLSFFVDEAKRIPASFFSAVYQIEVFILCQLNIIQIMNSYECNGTDMTII